VDGGTVEASTFVSTKDSVTGEDEDNAASGMAVIILFYSGEAVECYSGCQFIYLLARS
jgi:hypothetical protein